MEITSDGDIIVSSVSPFRANVARWGKEWHYTHVAVGKNVLAGAINHALYLGVAATLVPLLPASCMGNSWFIRWCSVD